MSRIGFAVGGNKVQDIQVTIQRAEELGVDAAWMTTGGARLDSLTVFAAAAGSTQKIKFGTSIVLLQAGYDWAWDPAIALL